MDASENFDAGVQKITTEDSGGVVKEYLYVGQLLPKNIRKNFDSNPGTYAASYDTVVLEVDEIEKSPSGSARDTADAVVAPSPEELSTIKIADLFNLVNDEYPKYIPDYLGGDTTAHIQAEIQRMKEDVSNVASERQTAEGRYNALLNDADLVEAERRLSDMRSNGGGCLPLRRLCTPRGGVLF